MANVNKMCATYRDTHHERLIMSVVFILRRYIKEIDVRMFEKVSFFDEI